jgi:AraC family transcriptional regulator, regulatory protein of adaptative response / DNA-3-methyladenine glycosylase II
MIKKVLLPYHPPFDFERILRFYGSHQMGQLEKFEPGKMIRVVSFEGQQGLIEITHDQGRQALSLTIDMQDQGAVPEIISKVRRLFDLDCDPAIIAKAFECDPVLSALFKKHPGIRIPTGWDPFEVGIATILGQLITVRQASKLVGDVIEHYGEDSGLVFDGKHIKLFPTPDRIARSSLSKIKTTGQRKETLKNFAKAVRDKIIVFDVKQNPDEFHKKLLAIKGIGPWTADYMTLKVLKHADAFPSTDLVLAKALQIHPKECINKVSPWRGYAAVLLWSEYSKALQILETT